MINFYKGTKVMQGEISFLLYSVEFIRYRHARARRGDKIFCQVFEIAHIRNSDLRSYLD